MKVHSSNEQTYERTLMLAQLDIEPEKFKKDALSSTTTSGYISVSLGEHLAHTTVVNEWPELPAMI